LGHRPQQDQRSQADHGDLARKEPVRQRDPGSARSVEERENFGAGERNARLKKEKDVGHNDQIRDNDGDVDMGLSSRIIGDEEAEGEVDDAMSFN
jgi:hypothetical protein